MIAEDTLLTDEQVIFLDTVDDLARARIALVAGTIDASERIPQDVYRLLVDTELLVIDGPLEHGGGGGDIVTVALMLHRLAVASGAVAAVIGASHAYAAACRAAAAPDPTRLAGVAAGRWGAFAEGIAAPIVVERLSEGLRMTGLAEVVEATDLAEQLLVVGRADDGDFVAVEVSVKAAELGPLQARTGLRGLTCRSARLDGVTVSPDAVIGGGPVVAAARWYLQLTAAAVAVGVAEAALAQSVAYIGERRQFGRLLTEFAGLRAIVREMEDRVNASAALIRAAVAASVTPSPAGAAAVARACRVAGRTAVEVCADAIQLHGGYGYMTEYAVERLMRDAISARSRAFSAVPRPQGQ